MSTLEIDVGDLHPSAVEFTATELAAFSQAKARIFKVAISQIEPRVLDPHSTSDSTAYPFRFITTHSGHLTVELISRRRVNQRLETTAHAIGLLLLLGLIVWVVVFGDLQLGKRLFSRG